MTYMAHEGPDTGMAGAAHLTAIVGPVIPLLLWLARRNDDRFVSEEAAKATNFSFAALVAFVIATAVRIFVPLVGFLGTLAQWVIPLVTVYFCVQAYRAAKRATPASYPFEFKVVKTND